MTTRTRLFRIAAGVAAIAAISLTAAPAAQAAPSHHNTDPYNSGCGSSAYVMSSRSVPGGTISAVVSDTCGTNWMEYYGSTQWANKRAYSDEMGATGWENDYASWSYSMQVYAPGTTYFEGNVQIQGVTYKVICGASCRW